MEYADVEKAMKEKGLTIARLSRETGIAYSAFTDWKAGRYRPKYDKLIGIATYLDMDNEYNARKKTIAESSEDNEILIAYEKASLKDKNAVRFILGLPLIEETAKAGASVG